MNNRQQFARRRTGPLEPRNSILVAALLTLFAPVLAEASALEGDALDTLAEIISWLALIIAPTVAIAVFWLVHVLPEKIAEKKHHPQAQAIQMLCILSLFFGGLLWPLAWLWAYTKPVMYKMAYGTDVVKHGEHEELPDEQEEITTLRERIAELEERLGDTSRDGEDA